jgi:hypothetical protein
MVGLAVTVQRLRGRESNSLGLQLVAGDSDAVFVDLPHKPPYSRSQLQQLVAIQRSVTLENDETSRFSTGSSSAFLPLCAPR